MSSRVFFIKSILPALPFVEQADDPKSEGKKSLSQFLLTSLLSLDDPNLRDFFRRKIQEPSYKDYYLDSLFSLGLQRSKGSQDTDSSFKFNPDWLRGPDAHKESQRMLRLLGTFTAASPIDAGTPGSPVPTARLSEDGRHQFFVPLRKIFSSFRFALPLHRAERQLGLSNGPIDGSKEFSFDANIPEHQKIMDDYNNTHASLNDFIEQQDSPGVVPIMDLFPKTTVQDSTNPYKIGTATHLFPEKLVGNETVKNTNIANKDWWEPTMRATRGAHSQLMGSFLAGNASNLKNGGTPYFANQGEFDRFAWSMMQHANMIGTLLANSGDVSPDKMQEEITKASLPHAVKVVQTLQKNRPKSFTTQASQPVFKMEHKTWDGSCKLAHDATSGALADSPSHWDIDEIGD